MICWAYSKHTLINSHFPQHFSSEECRLNILFAMLDRVSIIERIEYPVMNATAAYRYGNNGMDTFVTSKDKPKKLPVSNTK